MNGAEQAANATGGGGGGGGGDPTQQNAPKTSPRKSIPFSLHIYVPYLPIFSLNCNFSNVSITEKKIGAGLSGPVDGSAPDVPFGTVGT